MSIRRDQLGAQIEVELAKWQDVFFTKFQEYGDQIFDFDVRAQALEISRKNGKVRKMLWDGETSQFETLEEVLQDLVGHCMLALARLQLEGSPHEE